MQDGPRYSVYVVKSGVVQSQRHTPTKRLADQWYLGLARDFTAGQGYEVCLYRDDEMIASTWNRAGIN